MSYFLLPKVNLNIYSHIQFLAETNPLDNHISNSLYHYLLNIKTKIEENSQWDNIKKYTNPYEYIHTSVPSQKQPVCTYKPISRSYFKMIEIIKTFRLLDRFARAPGFCSFHLAEGPGGFIEAVANLRRNTRDIYIGMTLIDDKNDEIPGWKKSRDFLLKTPNVFLEKGADGTGNILRIENLAHCCEKYGSKMDFITADGGFDFTMNFNEQEKIMIPLLFAQMTYALFMQRHGGTFVLKIFDCFMNATVDILYILSAFYEKVHIIKPHTSRYANSERYVVCTGFLFHSAHYFQENLMRTFHAMLCNIHIVPRFLKINIPYIFIKRVEECNAVIGQQQLENIYSTINLIDNKHKNEKIDYLKKINIQKCVNWCIEHDMPYSGGVAPEGRIAGSY